MKHQLSADDRQFRKTFEACLMDPQRFDHRAHLRLAYIYLVEHEDTGTARLMRNALQTFLRHHGMDVSKYHETMTRAWILAVRHFMEISAPCPSADAFIDANPVMLDSRIMMTHYSAEVLFGDDARARFVEPDKDRLPRYRP